MKSVTVPYMVPSFSSSGLQPNNVQHISKNATSLNFEIVFISIVLN